MPLAIDTGTVLRAMADHADAFPAVKADMAEFARKALAKQVKAKDLKLDLARTLCAALGEPTFRMFLDDLKPSDLLSVAKRLDPHHAVLKEGTDQDVRNLVVDLATGTVSPRPAAEKPPRGGRTRTPQPTTNKVGKLLESKVHSGRARGAKAGQGSAPGAEDGPKPKRQPRADR